MDTQPAADLSAFMASLRGVTAQHGAAWVQAQLAQGGGPVAGGSSGQRVQVAPPTLDVAGEDLGAGPSSLDDESDSLEEGEVRGAATAGVRSRIAAVPASAESQPVGPFSGTGARGGAAWAFLPRSSMEPGLRTAFGLMARAVSQPTWRGREEVWREWQQFCRRVGSDGASGELIPLLLMFVGDAFGAGASAAGIAKKLSGLSFWFRMIGVQDVTKDFLVRQAMAGYRKARVARDFRRPVSFSILGDLVRVLETLCTDGYEWVLFRAAFSLAFFGAFRIGELVSRSCVSGDGLQVRDVEVGEGSVSCWLRKSKTDQAGRGKHIRLYAIGDCAACPVKCVSEYLKVRSGGREGPLLLHRDGRALSRFQFVAVFRKGLVCLGLPAMEFASHSFRIGAATEAVRCGLSESVVRQIGRWESARFRSYVRMDMI
ncbi:uncharacterized protein [Dendropsophus ebraccatus]|uniref:uncharacterized protein n=1 Tax=Dendropsophus ebraccatus TaxID=150705 RepID=UPI0038316459